MQEEVGNQWMTIPSFYLGKVGGPFLFDCNYDINLLNLNTVAAFYIDVLNLGLMLKVRESEMMTEPIREI